MVEVISPTGRLFGGLHPHRSVSLNRNGFEKKGKNCVSGHHFWGVTEYFPLPGAVFTTSPAHPARKFRSCFEGRFANRPHPSCHLDHTFGVACRRREGEISSRIGFSSWVTPLPRCQGGNAALPRRPFYLQEPEFVSPNGGARERPGSGVPLQERCNEGEWRVGSFLCAGLLLPVSAAALSEIRDGISKLGALKPPASFVYDRSSHGRR